MAAGALGLLENAPVIGGMVQHAEEGGDKMGSPKWPVRPQRDSPPSKPLN